MGQKIVSKFSSGKHIKENLLSYRTQNVSEEMGEGRKFSKVLCFKTTQKSFLRVLIKRTLGNIIIKKMFITKSPLNTNNNEFLKTFIIASFKKGRWHHTEV